MKKIMHLIHSGGFYGAEAVILNLCIGLKERGFSPIIGCFMDATDDNKPEIGIKAEEHNLTVLYFSFQNKLDIGILKTISEQIKKHNIELIHSHGYKPSIYCAALRLMFGIPFIVTCHLWTKETILLYLYNFLEHFSMIFAMKIVAVSHSIEKDITQWHFLKRKTSVINNGIDVTKYHQSISDEQISLLKKEIGIHPNSIVIGTLGRLVHQKAQHRLIEAINIVRKKGFQVECIIGGDGPLRDNLEQLSKNLGIASHIHFLGFRRDAIDILKSFSIFVLCSMDEGLPITLLESMSVGTPVIVTDVGEIPFLISNEINGLIVKNGNQEELVNSIIKLSDNKSLQQKLSCNAKQTVSSLFTISHMTEKYINIYLE